MTYDALNRLTGVTGENGAPSPMFGIASYSYDVLDNLTHVSITGGSKPRNQDYCYDEHNRLANIKTGGCTGASVLGLGYDAQGNLANRNGTTHTFAFDYGNRLRTGELESYRYDVQGRRIRSSSSAGVIYSLYAQSGQLLFQRDERSGKRRQYVYLGGSLLAESSVPLVGSTATVTYQHTDALGSPVATTNGAKAVLQRSEYEPYGYLLNRTMEDGPGYTGHVTDAATGLVYMQQRYYDPLCGCFVSTDPKTAYDTGDMRLFTRYAYAGNNPYKFTDPDGRKYDFPGITPQGRKDIKEAFRYLNKSEVAGGLLKELDKADGTVHIVISPAGSNHTEYDPETKTLHWDARAGLKVGDKAQTPALGLLHEAAHGLADLKGENASTKPIPGDPYDNAEEKRVIQKIETPAATELNEPTRNDHQGKGVLVECATCQK